MAVCSPLEVVQSLLLGINVFLDNVGDLLLSSQHSLHVGDCCEQVGSATAEEQQQE